jgi:hypothetical protein
MEYIEVICLVVVCSEVPGILNRGCFVLFYPSSIEVSGEANLRDPPNFIIVTQTDFSVSCLGKILLFLVTT